MEEILVVFDLDGTLVDSKPAIKACFIKITLQLAPSRLDFAKNILIGPTLQETASQILTEERINLVDKFIYLFKYFV